MIETKRRQYEESFEMLLKDRDTIYKTDTVPLQLNIQKVDKNTLTEEENLFRIRGIQDVCEVGHTGIHSELYQILIDHFDAETIINLMRKYEVNNVEFSQIPQDIVQQILEDLKEYL